MPFDIANSLRPAQPVSAFLQARDNAYQNQLVKRQDMRQQQAFDDRRAAAQAEAAKAAEIEAAKYAHTAAQYVLASKTPKATLQQMAATDPKVADVLNQVSQQHGINWDDVNDQDVLAFAQNISAHVGPILGISPPQDKWSIAGNNAVRLPADPNGTPQFAAPPAPPETFGAPSEMVIDGSPAIVRPGNRGTNMQLPGARPYNAPPSTPRPSRGQGTRQLPLGALRIIDDANAAIGAASESLVMIDSGLDKVSTGKVKLGLVNNATARARNITGQSTDQSLAYADVKQSFEKLRNNYLLLAKGVQTEGDATRAWNSEIGQDAANDNKLAEQQLRKAKAMMERMAARQRARIESVYSAYGSNSDGTDGEQDQTPPPPTPYVSEEWERGPDGKLRRKQP